MRRHYSKPQPKKKKEEHEEPFEVSVDPDFDAILDAEEDAVEQVRRDRDHSQDD
jgi:hypothetical protein